MRDNQPKLDELISHRPLGRPLPLEAIGGEFKLILRAFGTKVPTAQSFGRVAEASGTHLLKLVTARAPTGACVLRFEDKNSNRKPRLYPSLDAKMAPVAKLVFRPWEVKGHDDARSLADHILNPDDELSPMVTKGFADAFGEDSLEVLRKALKEPLAPIITLPAEEFPIIFLPCPVGGDLQVTPLAPAEAYVRFGEVTQHYFEKQVEGAKRVPRGRWVRQFVADKPQNISSAAGKERTRFLATMPQKMGKRDAEIYRYVKGGWFPSWRDDGLADAVDGYVGLLDRSEEYNNANIRDGLDRRADQLIEAARAFIDEIVADAKELHPAETLRGPPSVADLIVKNVGGEIFDRARRALTSDHFRDRLTKAAEN